MVTKWRRIATERKCYLSKFTLIKYMYLLKARTLDLKTAPPLLGMLTLVTIASSGYPVYANDGSRSNLVVGTSCKDVGWLQKGSKYGHLAIA
jgi:hypothetical protein